MDPTEVEDRDMARTEIHALESRIGQLERSARLRRRRLRLWLLAAVAVVPAVAYASTLSVPNTLVNGNIADADEINDNFEAVKAWSESEGTTATSGYIRIGDVQIVYGSQVLPVPGGGQNHVRFFTQNFPVPFIQIPRVTTGVNNQSPGYAYQVFAHNLTTNLFAGTLLEVENRQDPTSTPTMNYMAIGKWK